MESPDRSPAPGSLFANRFEIDRPVGAGGMGLVYRARDRYTGSWVALKVLHDSLQSGPLGERFLREAQLLSELQHPHIVAYVVHGETVDGRRFLAMEWLDGHDLAERLRQGPLDLKSSLRLIEHVADGLAIAHERGIVHRDLKPTNLFLPQGDIDAVKILDFGIARRAAGDPTLTRTGNAVGTPEYMAPEQARGLRELSPATDIFSLGCVLHYCLTGKAPFAAESLAAVLVRILFDEAPLLEHPPATMPQAVLAMLRQMLRKEPAQRFVDARALLAVLRVQGFSEQAAAGTTASDLRIPLTQSGYRLEGGDDQELFSVVIVQPPLDDVSSTVTLGLASGESQESVLASLRSMGVRVESVLGGALVVTVPTMESAVDQAAQAARAALLIKRLWPQARVALATGRGVVKGHMAIGEVASRALQMLVRSSSGQAEDEEPEAQPQTGVWTDRLSGQLLPQSFKLDRLGERCLLSDEREFIDASRPLLGKPTPCVGREAELSTLEGHLETCLGDGEFRGVTITGPTGSGKSRLRHEFIRRATQNHQELRVLVGRGELLSAGAPYYILAAALRRFWGLDSDMSPAERCARIEELAAELNEKAAAAGAPVIAPEFIGELCSISLSAERYPALRTARQDPGLMQLQLRRTFVSWLEQECRRGPLLFVFDDLQWGDALTVGLLDHAMQEQSGSPWFVLALARPEVHGLLPKLWQGRPVQEVLLKGLSRKACERLIQHALGAKVSPAILAKIIEQSAGNALFLEELIRATAEGNQESLPETVLAMLQARIGRLPLEARRTLRAASVFGQTFWSGGVAAALDTGGEERLLQQTLQQLLASEFIERQADSLFPGQVQYGFRHIPMREAAYQLLTDSDRIGLHRVAGLFLEQQPNVEPRMVADHFLHGQEAQRAVPWSLRAAQHALDSNDLAAAAAYADQALGCGPEGESLGALRALKTQLAYWSSDYPRCRELAELERKELQAGTVRWYQATTHALVACGRTGDFAGLEALQGELLQVMPLENAAAEQVISLLRASHIWRLAGRFDQVDGLVDRATASIAECQISAPLALAQHHEVMGSFFDFYEAPIERIRHMESAVACYEQAGDLRNLAFSRSLVGAMWQLVGCGEEGERLLRANLAACQKMKFSPGANMAKSLLAVALLRRRRSLPEVRSLLNETIAWYQQIRYPSLVIQLLLGRAELEYAEGRFAEAIEQVLAVRATCGQLAGVSFALSISHALEARALLGLGRATEALAPAREAAAWLSAGRTLGLPSWEHLPRLALAEVLVALGRRSEARPVIAALSDWLQRFVQAIGNPEWRAECLQLADYPRIRELAAQ